MPTLSVFADVPPAHKLEGSLFKTYKQDDHPNKIFLAYRVCMTSEGHPWVSLVVRKTRLQIAQDPSLNCEYLPTMGMKSFVQASLELLFGKHNQAMVENRIGGVHIIGDSGAFQLGAQFLRNWHKDAQVVCIVSSQKELHGLVFQDMGFAVYEYSIWDPQQLCMSSHSFLDIVEPLNGSHAGGQVADNRLVHLQQVPRSCILVIGNIIDCKLTHSQWTKVVSIMKSKRIFLFLDAPCQGFYTGDLEQDVRILRFFVSRGFEFFCSQSLSKNFGIYDEGVGILVVVAFNNQCLLHVLSHLSSYAQALWLNPPSMGARIITSILCNPALQEGWKQSLKGIMESIMLIKEKVKERLRLLGTPGSWDHITEQNGTHGYLGLTTQQIDYLVKKKHIYIPRNSRINFTCINAHNIEYITQSIHEAVLLVHTTTEDPQAKDPRLQ